VTILLVVDTCALLDLIRSPVREEFTPSYATGARNLLAALKAPQAPARIVCTDVVQNEYQRHVVPVTEETKRFLTQARNKYRQALSVIGGLSAGSIPTSVDDAWACTRSGTERTLFWMNRSHFGRILVALSIGRFYRAPRRFPALLLISPVF
jgi:hypothetical protein